MKADRLYWLDYARFLAAFAVMAFHLLANGPRHGMTGAMVGYGALGQALEYGYLGVDVFFVISGFVILNSSEGRRPDQFAVSRATKLWPTFILCATLTAATLLAFGKHVGIVQYLGNLTMLPSFVGVASLDGVYWTLVYEIIFYGCFFLLIITGLLKKIRWVLPVWIAGMIVARLTNIDIPPVGQYFELFAAGCALALVHRNGWKLDLIIAVAVCLALAFFSAEHRALARVERGVDPQIAASIVTAALFAFILLLRTKVKLPAANVVGDLTYPLYLLHAQIGYQILAHLSINKWIAVVSVMIFNVLLAVIVVLGFEHPTRKLRKNLFDRTIGIAIRKMYQIFGRNPVQT